MPDNAQRATAYFVVKHNGQEQNRFDVCFNPASLTRNIQSTLRGNRTSVQYVNQLSASLSMELVYDTTMTGDDVRKRTNELVTMLQPVQRGSGRRSRKPPLVEFHWGSYVFTGVVTKYEEIIDYFAPVGVPLRATIKLTLKQQDKSMSLRDQVEENRLTVGGSLDAVEVPNTGSSMQNTASQAGDPSATHAYAAQNGEESIRHPTNASHIVDNDDGLLSATAFASGGAGFGAGGSASVGGAAGAGAGFSAGAGASLGGGVGAGAGLSAGAGASLSGGTSASVGGGASASFGPGAGAGFSGGASASMDASISGGAGAGFGSQASAGVSSSSGAFSGLHTRKNVSSTSRLDTEQISLNSSASGSGSFNVAADSEATFELGGKSSVRGSTGLRADVGANASLSQRIRFDSE